MMISNYEELSEPSGEFYSFPSDLWKTCLIICFYSPISYEGEDKQLSDKHPSFLLNFFLFEIDVVASALAEKILSKGKQF